MKHVNLFSLYNSFLNMQHSNCMCIKLQFYENKEVITCIVWFQGRFWIVKSFELLRARPLLLRLLKSCERPLSQPLFETESRLTQRCFYLETSKAIKVTTLRAHPHNNYVVKIPLLFTTVGHWNGTIHRQTAFERP